MRDEYRIVPLKRNGVGYLIGKYVYIKDGTNGGGYPNIVFLRCQKYKTCRARGTLSITASCALDCEDSHHNHPPPDVIAMLFRQAAIRNASDPRNVHLAPKGIYEKTVTEFFRDGFASKEIPSFGSVKWAIKTHMVKSDTRKYIRGTMENIPDAVFRNNISVQQREKSAFTNTDAIPPHPTDADYYSQMSSQLIQQAKDLETSTGCKVKLEIIASNGVNRQSYTTMGFPPPIEPTKLASL